MSSKTSSSSRAKKTKIEVQQELLDIGNQVLSEKEALTSRESEVLKLKQIETREAVKDVGVEGIVKQISTLGLEINKNLSSLSDKLLEEVKTLENLRTAVELEKKELERLHQMDVLATSVDYLLQDYENKKSQFDFEMKEKEEEWEKRKLQTERDQKEFEENLKKQRQREKEEFEYKLELERQKEQDEYDSKQKTLERLNKEKQENLDKSWKEREFQLKAKEEEFNQLKKEVTEFSQRLQNELTKQSENLKKEFQMEHEQKMLILRKDSESNQKLAEYKIQSLEESIARQNQQISALEKELKDAKQQVQDIAIKAIEGASGAKALSHINQIAMEQAKGKGQGM